MISGIYTQEYLLRIPCSGIHVWSPFSVIRVPEYVVPESMISRICNPESMLMQPCPRNHVPDSMSLNLHSSEIGIYCCEVL